ncbi:hypothetical protein EPN96_00870 [bacterium]|nr:MAG: hypothetical protein EPN96_00870 [bacterium]
MFKRSRASRFVMVFALALAGSSLVEAGLNPLDPGLPQGWTPTAGNGYAPVIVGIPADRLSLTNSWGSALCVECHNANPSTRTLLPMPGPLPAGDLETMYRGSHFVKNYSAGAWSAATTTSNTFTAEKVTAWAGSGAFSQYGTLGTNATNAIPPGGPSVAGEMICESCHNVTKNVGDQLLLENWNNATGVATVCEGCHPNPALGPPYHHALSSGAASPTSNDVGPDTENPLKHDLNTGHASHVLATPRVDSGGIAYFTGTVTCVTCHKPHDAMSASAARILRRGNCQFTGVAGMIGRQLNVVYYDNIPPGFISGSVVERSATGIGRQSDFSPLQLITNSDPLCDACHI